MIMISLGDGCRQKGHETVLNEATWTCFFCRPLSRALLSHPPALLSPSPVFAFPTPPFFPFFPSFLL